MNTDELVCILSRALRESNTRFLGVFAADQAPLQLPPYSCAYVVNTDPASSPGTHWVAFVAKSPLVLEYYDSYGKPLRSYPQIRVPYGRRIISNTTLFQSRRSTVCGHYAIFFIIQRTILNQSRSFLLRVLREFKRGWRGGGVPYPQDKMVRRFVQNYVRRLCIVQCVAACRRCGGGQCCRPAANSRCAA